MTYTIACLPGDGIGPEVTHEAIQILRIIETKSSHRFNFTFHTVGGDALARFGQPLPSETLAACKQADAVLLGAVGDPRWDGASVRPEQGLLELRQALGLYANLRPIFTYSSLSSVSPLRDRNTQNVNFLFVRELTGGLYFGKPRFREETAQGVRAVDTLEYTDYEIRRIVEMAFRLADIRKKKVTSIDKANVLESSRLWRQVASEVASKYPSIQFENQLVDSAAMKLITDAQSFDVVVTENMFGDILTDEASVISGSLGLLPSASIGNGPSLYEPIHGSAPDIAGKGIANPIGAILSVALLLRYSFKLEDEAQAIEAAVEKALSNGARTRDLGGQLSTRQMGEAVASYLLFGV